MTLQNTQQAYEVMQQMAALCATPGVSVENVEVANEIIKSVLDKIIKPSALKLTAEATGLIVK